MVLEEGGRRGLPGGGRRLTSGPGVRGHEMRGGCPSAHPLLWATRCKCDQAALGLHQTAPAVIRFRMITQCCEVDLKEWGVEGLESVCVCAPVCEVVFGDGVN